jgi:hypothetical protein
MARAFRTTSYTSHEFFDGRHRFEHWYRDNTIYFITARCRDAFPAFASERTKGIFWDRFDFYSDRYGFVPAITTLMNNHYHTLGHIQIGENVGKFIQHLHGSVAKLVNDTLSVSHLPFWRTAGNKDYFDGCIRDVLQMRRAYRYTLLQAVRAGLVRDYRDYPHTQVIVDVDTAVAKAIELHALLEDVPYARYDRKRG